VPASWVSMTGRNKHNMASFVALIMLESRHDVILHYLVEFHEILKVGALSSPRLFVSKVGYSQDKMARDYISIATS
jgi:hypothetical protein